MEDRTMKNDDLVLIKDYIPNILIELKYATNDNFVHQKVYDFTEPSLRYGTVKKLQQVQKELNKKGYSLKVWDAYRPTAVQFKFWEVCPNEDFVANPITGFSNHSRGNAIDVTITDLKGNELKMPSKFDDFSDAAKRNYDWLDETTKNNVLLLESTMEKYGFESLPTEWWHYADKQEYPVVK